jgi:uncharacterized RDD family membrane protein YckC
MSANAYLRHRRLAYAISLAVLVLLSLFVFTARLPDVYGRPTLLVRPGEWTILHDADRGKTSDHVQVAVTLDPATLAPRARVPLFGGATAAAAQPDGVLVFYGRRYARLAANRLADLDGRPVVAAVADGTATWMVSIDARRLVARRLEGESAGEEETVATTPSDIEWVLATSSEAGPTVTWREQRSTRLQMARRVDGTWRPWDEVDVGPAQRWTTLQLGSRQLVISHVRDDRSWRAVILRVACCRACGLPPPPPRWAFGDTMILGRYLTGISAAPAGGRLVLCVTRTSSVQLASVPLDALAPEPGARLRSIPSDFPWPQAVIVLFILSMLLFAISLIYLGASLMRQRRAFILAALGTREPPGPRPADLFQRLMAFAIDLILLATLQVLALDTLDLMPAGPELRLDGPTLRVIALVASTQFLYFFLLEWLLGRTLGKRLLSLRVTRLDGTRIGPLAALIRNLMRVVDLGTVVTGALSILSTRRRQRLGDILAATLVVQDDLPVEPADPSAVSLRQILEKALREARERNSR